jgi:hypothetical protein
VVPAVLAAHNRPAGVGDSHTLAGGIRMAVVAGSRMVAVEDTLEAGMAMLVDQQAAAGEGGCCRRICRAKNRLMLGGAVMQVSVGYCCSLLARDCEREHPLPLVGARLGGHRRRPGRGDRRRKGCWSQRAISCRRELLRRRLGCLVRRRMLVGGRRLAGEGRGDGGGPLEASIGKRRC